MIKESIKNTKIDMGGFEDIGLRLDGLIERKQILKEERTATFEDA